MGWNAWKGDGRLRKVSGMTKKVVAGVQKRIDSAKTIRGFILTGAAIVEVEINC